MTRQSTTPVQFQKSRREDSCVAMTSGRAGLVQLLGFVPLLRGDSASGKVAIDLDLAEMPRPLLNGCMMNVQAWFVPKQAHPQFAGYDEFMHSYQREVITALGQPNRQAPPFFQSSKVNVTLQRSQMFKALGIHFPEGSRVNFDLIDAYNLVYNFRLAAHSSRLPLRDFAINGINNATKFGPAFWPSSRFSRVVPDYERALVLGSLDLDVAAGTIPIEGLYVSSESGTTRGDVRPILPGGNVGAQTEEYRRGLEVLRTGGSEVDPVAEMVRAQMAGQTINVTLADIDKARTTQSFAKLRAAYAGNETTGFSNDDTIVAELMQGLNVPSEMNRRPWLLDSKRVAIGFNERHATNSGALDQSVTQGSASASLSINVPVSNTGGMIIYTVEVLPERIYERQADEFINISTVEQLPDALRDVQRVEPVDMVLARRADARHTNPNTLYGYEPMNDVWNRSFTRLGGAFYQDDPNEPFTEQRSGIWQPNIIDPTFTEDHFLAPLDFPHDVFADTNADAFECVVRHEVAIVGLTQIGDVLHENNDDFEAVLTGE